MKTFDFIKQVFQGKSFYRILSNWQIQKHCRNLSGLCLDLAAGEKPSYTQYWSFSQGARLIKTDYNETKGVNLRIDFNQPLPLSDDSLDNIFLFGAIYIVKEPDKLVKEIYRVLKKNGKFFIVSPFVFNEANEPDDFRRLTSQGLSDLLTESGFSNFLIIPFGERFSASAHLLHSFFVFNFIRFVVFSLALLFDELIPNKIKRLHPCPVGYFVIAKKS